MLICHALQSLANCMNKVCLPASSSTIYIDELLFKRLPLQDFAICFHIMGEDCSLLQIQCVDVHHLQYLHFLAFLPLLFAEPQIHFIYFCPACSHCLNFPAIIERSITKGVENMLGRNR